MPVTVVIGGQFGSEGKGKVAHFLAKEMDASIAVRVGGPNSGHTVVDKFGTVLIFKQLPTAAILPRVACVLGAGSYINPDILTSEIICARLSKDRLIIDPNAVVISEREIDAEKSGTLGQMIGSTLSGTGEALLSRINRNSSIRLAKDDSRLKPFIQPAVPFMRSRLSVGERIIIEGTQGFGLSLLHSPHYPFTTSRDTTAAAFISEAGLSPMDIDDVVMVLRAFPIRVPGNSGPLPNEIDWDVVTKESGSAASIIEYTSVTRSIRRVARFGTSLVRQAILYNNPTRIVLNHIDYVDAACHETKVLSKKASHFVKNIESLIGRPIDYIGFNASSLVKIEQLPTRMKFARPFT
jgi:adenylosuccinate synthase